MTSKTRMIAELAELAADQREYLDRPCTSNSVWPGGYTERQAAESMIRWRGDRNLDRNGERCGPITTLEIMGIHDSNGNVSAVLPEELASMVDAHQGNCLGLSYVWQALRQLGECKSEKGSPERGWRFSCSIDSDRLHGALCRMQRDSMREEIARHEPGWGSGWGLHEWINGVAWDHSR